MTTPLPALFPQTYPFSLDFLPDTAYLVGGAVRDALLQRQRDYLDLDFVIPGDVIDLARNIARQYQAGFVILDSQRGIVRVVFDHATVDFAQQEGQTLEIDLQRRDFTINAIAYHPTTYEIIDPLGGCQDLEKGIIRMISANNLQDDPLRLLRAYRQASQLNFIIEAETRSTLRQLAPFLTQIAIERIQVELNYLFTSSLGTDFLNLAWEDQLLPVIFGDRVSRETLDQLTQIEATLAELNTTLPKLVQSLANPIPGLAAATKKIQLSIAKLTALLVPFTRLETVHPGEVIAFLSHLKYSNAEIKAIQTTLTYLPQLQTNSLTLREQYFFFQNVLQYFPIIALIALASQPQFPLIFPLIDRYFNPQDLIAHPQPLVTGNDLIKALNLKPSPWIGTLLAEIQIAHAEGKISTFKEALELATQFSPH